MLCGNISVSGFEITAGHHCGGVNFQNIFSLYSSTVILSVQIEKNNVTVAVFEYIFAYRVASKKPLKNPGLNCSTFKYRLRNNSRSSLWGRDFSEYFQPNNGQSSQ